MKKDQEAESSLIHNFGQLDETSMLDSVKLLLDEGYSSYELLELLNKGAAIVGDIFESGEYYIADLIASGILYTHAMDLLDLAGESSDEDKGLVLIGVMHHDVHDIGKDIVCSVLRSDGFKVVDLGVDVKKELFLSAAIERRPDIVALAGTLSFSTVEMERVISLIRLEDTLKSVPIIIGGACASDTVRMQVGADAYTNTPLDTLNFCNEHMNIMHDNEKKS